MLSENQTPVNVQCSVVNCKYHTKENGCCIKDLKIGPAYASTQSDTVCTSFKPQ